MNATTCSGEIGHFVRFREWGLVDLTEELSLGVLPVSFDLKVERDRDKVLLDHLKTFVAEEPGPGSSAGASRPPQWMTIADPD